MSPEDAKIKIHPAAAGEPAAFDVVAIVASAGGLNALIKVLSGLPDPFPAAIAVVQHLDPRHRSLMADILSRHTALRTKQAEEGDAIVPGIAYIAPPNTSCLWVRSFSSEAI